MKPRVDSAFERVCNKVWMDIRSHPNHLEKASKSGVVHTWSYTGLEQHHDGSYWWIISFSLSVEYTAILFRIGSQPFQNFINSCIGRSTNEHTSGLGFMFCFGQIQHAVSLLSLFVLQQQTHLFHMIIHSQRIAPNLQRRPSHHRTREYIRDHKSRAVPTPFFSF